MTCCACKAPTRRRLEILIAGANGPPMKATAYVCRACELAGHHVTWIENLHRRVRGQPEVVS